MEKENNGFKFKDAANTLAYAFRMYRADKRKEAEERDVQYRELFPENIRDKSKTFLHGYATGEIISFLASGLKDTIKERKRKTMQEDIQYRELFPENIRDKSKTFLHGYATGEVAGAIKLYWDNLPTGRLVDVPSEIGKGLVGTLNSCADAMLLLGSLTECSNTDNSKSDMTKWGLAGRTAGILAASALAGLIITKSIGVFSGDF